MRDRRDTLLWMKDLIDHMTLCHEQLQWAGDTTTETFLADSLLVDLTECRRLCLELKTEGRRSARMMAESLAG